MTPTETYYKAVRPDGTDFHSRTVRWLPPVGEPLPDGGLIVTHPTTRKKSLRGAATYLSVSTVPTDCTGFDWPCRLARVERTRAAVWAPDTQVSPHKRASWQWRVVEELDPKLALGPNADAVLAVIEQAKRMPVNACDDDGRGHVSTAQTAAYAAMQRAASHGARDAARTAAGAFAYVTVGRTAPSARWAAWDAAAACVVRDLIDPDAFAVLTEPWNGLVRRYLNDAKTESLPS